MICCRLVLAGEFGWVIVEADGHGGFFVPSVVLLVVVPKRPKRYDRASRRESSKENLARQPSDLLIFWEDSV